MRFRSLLALIPAAVGLAAAPAASAAFIHTVAPGESLYSIAAADGLSVAALAAANGLSPDAMLQAGSAVAIPPQEGTVGGPLVASPVSTGVTPVADAATGDGDADSDDVGADSSSATSAGTPTYVYSSASAPSSPAGAYVVAPGDTLSAIAARAGTSVAALAAANGLDPAGLLIAGRVLRLAGAATGTTTYVSSSSTQPVGAASTGAGGPPYPTPERLSASQVGQVAAANGVPASLADAIGWQESGFNNDLVSGTGAVGVMQVEPGTWDWIQRTLTAGTPLAPASAIENVRGGVLLLHWLLNNSGGNPALAAAGYYQGLPSVERHGMYADTQQYVQNVMALQRQFGGG